MINNMGGKISKKITSKVTGVICDVHNKKVEDALKLKIDVFTHAEFINTFLKK